MDIKELLTKDYLEIHDMDDEELMRFKKAELVKLINQMAMEMYEMEQEG